MLRTPAPLIGALGRSTRYAKALVSNSKQIAAVLGPTMIAMLVAEFPLVQPHLYNAQIPPVVYLSGTLLFVAGLAIVRAHNIWVRNWTVLVTGVVSRNRRNFRRPTR